MSTNPRKFYGLGMAPELAANVAEAIDGAAGSPDWANINGTQAGVEAAVKAKAAIAALTSGSTAADIVAALKA